MPPRFDDAALHRLRTILGSRPAISIDEARHRRACVIVPLVRSEAGWSLLFLKRSETLASHSGQIAFPGGVAEAGETLEEAALREAEEEVGLTRDRVELIGRLDDLITVTGFVVAPFVGVVNDPVEYVMQASEVVDIFEVPLEALMKPENPEVRYIEYRGRRYPSLFYLYEQREIWGLTGRMVKLFLDEVWLSL